MPMDQVVRVGIFSRLISLGKLFLGSIGFFFRSNIGGLHLIWQNLAKTPVSAISTAFSATLAFLSGLILYQSKNKNFGKAFEFLYLALQATLAILAASTLLSMVAVQALLLSAVALNIIYSLGGLLYSLYKYKSYSKNTSEYINLKKIYKQAMVKYAIGMAISMIILVAFLVCSLFFAYVSPIVSLSVGLLASVIFLSFGIYNAYKFFSASRNNVINAPNQINTNPTSEMAFHQSFNKKPAGFEYYYAKDRCVHLTGNISKDSDFLVKEMAEKIFSLNQQINKAKGTGYTFWSEASKRVAKQDFLKKFLVILLALRSSSASNNHFPDLEKKRSDTLDRIEMTRLFEIDDTIYKELNVSSNQSEQYYCDKFQQVITTFKNNAVYQSFFKKTGDVEDIIKATEAFFKNLAEKEVREENTSPAPSFMQR